MDSRELIRFLLWAEQVSRPNIYRLCEHNANFEFGTNHDEYNPVFQTISYNGTPLGNDSPGQAGIRALVEEYNDWNERSKTPGKARELLSRIVDEDDNTGA